MQKNFSTFPQLDGIIVLNKPRGPSSNQCLKVFKRLGQKKVGHAGTLDPLAEGVLIILLGQATKLSGYLLTGGKKIYSGKMQLGIETDTWDMEGNVIRECSTSSVRMEDIENEIFNWKNISEQIVPPYSAAKCNGQPLYKLARKGKETPQKIKKIQIFEAGILEINMPFVSFRVSCSSGSYIRSLAHSLGTRIGCGAALAELTREYSYPFDLEKSLPLAAIEAEPQLLTSNLVSLDKALPDWPKIQISAAQAEAVRNGKRLRLSIPANKTRVFLYEEDIPVALAQFDGDAFWKIIRGLWN